MCRQARLALPGATTAAGMARRFVAEHAREWDLPGLCEDLILTVSELVTNAVLHADRPTTLTISLAGDFVEAAVHDDSKRLPIVRPPRLDLDADLDVVIARAVADPAHDRDDGDERDAAWQVGAGGSIAAGRGLLIVDAIADEWGVTQLSEGKDVWFRLRTPTPPGRGSCLCPGSTTFTPGRLALRL